MSKKDNYLTSSKLRTKLKYLCYKYGKEQFFEDVLSEYVIHILEGKGRNQTVEQFFIDYSRIQGWCSREKQQNPILKHEFKEEFMAPVEAESPFIYEHVEQLEGYKRPVAMLLFKYNFTLEEVGDCFGLTPSRMSIISAKIKEELRNAILQ